MRRPMASLKDSPTPVRPLTALDGGQSFQTKYMTSLPERNPNPLLFDRIASGSLPLDRYRQEDVDLFLTGVTSKNLHEREQLVTRYLGGDEKDLGWDKVGNYSLRSELGLVVDSEASSAPNTEGREERLNRVYEKQQDLYERGSVYRAVTGLGYGFAPDATVNLFNDADRIVATIDPKMASVLVSESRFLPSVRLFARLASGAEVPDLRAAIEEAIAEVSKNNLQGDSWIFGSKEERVDAIMIGASKLRDGNLSAVERSILYQTLLFALAAEATPRATGLQMMMDMIPVIGQYRSVQRAGRSAKAAKEAFESGDIMEGAVQSGLVVLELFGAIGGSVTPAAAAASGTFRATVSRGVRVGKERGRELINAARIGRTDAAQLRVQEMARRAEGKQLEGIDRVSYNKFLTEMAPGEETKLKDMIVKAIGDAGEIFFEPILRRWSPEAISEASIKKLELYARREGNKELLKEATELRKLLEISRNGKNARADALVRDVFIVYGPDGVKFVRRELDEGGKPIVVDVKTGEVRKKQIGIYEYNANREITHGDSPTIDGHVIININGDEWRTVLRESLGRGISNYAIKNNLSKEMERKIYKGALEIYEVADLEKWMRYFGLEQYLTAELRAAAVTSDRKD